MPLAAIVGTGRCGTTWVHDVLKAVGLRAGHEDYWKPGGPADDGAHLDVDASLYAVPWLDEHHGWVFHQVREPLACIGSIVGWKMVAPDRADHHGSLGEWFGEHYDLGIDPIINAARYWLDCNRRCERGGRYVRYRVEDVETDPTIVQMIALAAGQRVGKQRVRLAVHRSTQRYPGTIKGPEYERVDLGWEDMPEPERTLVRERAERYGYL